MQPLFLLSTLLLSSGVIATPAPVLVARTPPNIPSTTTAKSQLAALTVKAQGSQDGYSRDLFPHVRLSSVTCF